LDDRDRVALFDEWAERYDKDVQSATGLHRGYEQVLDRVVEFADPRPGMRVLDLGVGTGNLARRFVDLGCAVWGVDFAPAMLAKAQAKVPQAKLLRVDLLDDTWPEDLAGQRFERVVSAYVFHEFSLEAKVRLLTRLARDYLAGGGRIVIGDVAFSSLQALRQAGADHWDEEEHYWAADEAIAACEAAGFELSYAQVSSCGGVFVFESGRPAMS
jgi:cyclopropane fatty-acyl-phospholipid synthase-like methyltransferase